jgi:hypothetical protein
MLAGCQLLQAFVGGIAGATSALFADRVAYQAKLSSIESIAKRNGVNKETRDRIYYFYEYNWDRSKGVDEATVNGTIPSFCFRDSLVGSFESSTSSSKNSYQ